MRISLGPSVVRSNIDESITGLWTFANVLGLLTDIIGERTAAAGVTVDGLLIKDAGIPEAAVTAHEAALAILESQITPGTLLARVASPETISGDWTFTEQIEGGDGIAFSTLPLSTTFAFLARVLSDTFARFTVSADGKMAWGSGAGARDTNLFRNAANELKTDDALTVVGDLTALSEIVLSVRDVSLSAQTNDFALGGKTIQRFLLSASLTFTGMIKAAVNQVVYIVNADSADTLTVGHEHTGSAAGNRIILRGATNLLLVKGEALGLWYDGTSSRWRELSS